MQLDMSEDIRLGSPPDDGSNNLDSDFNLLAVSQSGNTAVHHRDRWPVKDHTSASLQPLQSGNLPQEDAHYSQTVSAILQNQSLRCSNPSSTTATSSVASAFTKWSATPSAISTHRHTLLLDGAAQWTLKYILFTVPLLHTKSRDHTARKWIPPHQISATHVLAERRRREKLNERFIILRSLVPFVTKMDKVSILGDTIEYVKQLRKKIQDLEAEKSGPKRKMRIVEHGGDGGKAKVVEEPPPTAAVEVSIIESDALVEIECVHKEGLLLDVMKVLRELRIEVTTVQSSISNGVFAAELRAKVKESANGRKASIMEVKRSINQILR
ncbi:hypothetical protein CDL12_01396 [Handroanthus impetiginosus]|uniref:BHLH domain-containing protein n=1 Tax=Handroanthus impetiginosus TaxID=429701 RepID=A0A2G9I7W4_9LAMI|nr:hypothetical protein CDL12_01396 [Handroanthus impetiginosus]